MQTGKGLRLANVTFNNSPNTDHNKRLSAKPIQRQKRKSETSPSKTPISPTKDDEPRHSNESEEEVHFDGTRARKTYKNTKVRKRIQKPRNRKKTPKENVSRRIVKPKGKKSDSSEQTNGTVVHPDNEPNEGENLKVETTESETEWDLKSPGRSVESADTAEESSQDTIGCDSDISLIESVSDNSEDSAQENADDSSWTRQEDKVILQMFKEYGDGEHIYKNIQAVLSKRTVVDIRQRFRLLLSLLQEMSHV